MPTTRIALLLAVASLCGCTLYVPDRIKPVMSERGFHSTRTIRTPVGLYFTSITYLPGEGGGQPASQEQSATCASEETSARVLYSESDPQTARELCKAILDAIAFIAPYGRIPQRVGYRARLVPSGLEWEESTISLYPFKKIAPTFAVFDTPQVEREAVGIFVHEYVHMYRDLTRWGLEEAEQEEALAYKASVCAKLSVFGSISVQDMPGGAMQDESIAVVRSSGQAYEVRKLFWPYVWAGPLKSTSPVGSELLKQCRLDLQSFFGSP